MNKKQKRNNNFYPFSITSHHVISNYKESKRSELHARITRFSKVVGLKFKRRSRRMLPATEKRRSLEAEVAVRPRTSRATSAKVLAWGHSLSAISRQESLVLTIWQLELNWLAKCSIGVLAGEMARAGAKARCGRGHVATCKYGTGTAIPVQG